LQGYLFIIEANHGFHLSLRHFVQLLLRILLRLIRNTRVAQGPGHWLCQLLLILILHSRMTSLLTTCIPSSHFPDPFRSSLACCSGHRRLRARQSPSGSSSLILQRCLGMLVNEKRGRDERDILALLRLALWPRTMFVLSSGERPSILSNLGAVGFAGSENRYRCIACGSPVVCGCRVDLVTEGYSQSLEVL
jgi:hypothetical protein